MTKTLKPLTIFSPLPPSRTGIADYFYEQLPYLKNYFAITVVVEKVDKQLKADGIAVLDYKSWSKTKQDTETILYHLGNNPHHCYVFEELLVTKGIVVLHDYNNHYLINESTLAKGENQQYQDFMKMEIGEIGLKIARNRERQMFSEFMHFLIPLNTPAIRAADSVIVHSDWALQKMAENFPEKTVTKIPMHFHKSKVESTLEGDELKKSLGIECDSLVFVSLGFITPPKQIPFILEALSKIKDRIPKFEYWLIGEAYDQDLLDNEIARFGLQEQVHQTGFVSSEEFIKYTRVADISFNLRYPSAGETSRALLEAMGEGSCSIVFDYGPFTDYPESTIYKIPLSTFATSFLEEALLALSNNEELRESYKANAALYVAENNNIEDTVDLYGKFIESRIP